jgi:hypothetical protein
MIFLEGLFTLTIASRANGMSKTMVTTCLPAKPNDGWRAIIRMQFLLTQQCRPQASFIPRGFQFKFYLAHYLRWVPAFYKHFFASFIPPDLNELSS